MPNLKGYMDNATEGMAWEGKLLTLGHQTELPDDVEAEYQAMVDTIEADEFSGVSAEGIQSLRDHDVTFWEFCLSETGYGCRIFKDGRFEVYLAWGGPSYFVEGIVYSDQVEPQRIIGGWWLDSYTREFTPEEAMDIAVYLDAMENLTGLLEMMEVGEIPFEDGYVDDEEE